MSYGHVNPAGRGIGGFNAYVQEAATTRDGSVFANLVDLVTIRGAITDFLSFFDPRATRLHAGASPSR